MTGHPTPRLLPSDSGRRWHLLCSAVLVALVTQGCPVLPDGWGDTRFEDDVADAFVPLSLTRVDDNIGLPEGGERVMIRGGGLIAGAKVSFGDAPATDPLLLDSERLNVTTPAHEPGLVDVRVQLPDGQVATIDGGFLYTTGVAVTAISPTEGPTAGGTEVTVTGRALTRDTRVLVGGLPLVDQRVVDETTIAGRTAARRIDAAGRVDVIVTRGIETSLLEGAFRYVPPLSVAGLEPVAGPADGGQPLVLRGVGLSPACAVRVGDVPAEFLDHDALAGLLTVRTPAGPPSEAVDVSVSCEGAVVTLEDAYFYRPPTASTALRAEHLFPASGPRKGGGFVTLATRGLTGEAFTVTFGPHQAPVREVRRDGGFVVVEAPEVFSDGPVVVLIRQGASVSNGLFYTYEKSFGVDTVEPPHGAVEGGYEVTLTGPGLSGAGRVIFGGEDAEVASRFGNTLKVRVPAGTAGRVDVRVVTDDGREVLAPEGFEYRAGRTRVFGISPLEGAQAGGRIVRVHGEGFATRRPRLRFGDTAPDGVDVIDDALAVVRLPRGATEGRVSVDADDQGFLAMAMRYFDPTRPAGGVGAGPIPEALNVTVLDRVTGLPVEDAFVILWDDLDTPHQGLTDDRGQITFSEMFFGPPQMVTASRDDYTTASVVEFDGRDVTLILFPLAPSPPGNGGGGGGGPQPRDDTRITGTVSGLDKYVVTPPGSCEARLLTAPGTLCEPCASDLECAGDGARCTPLGDEGPRCTTACATDADCPESFRCAGVSSLEGPAVQCVPDAGIRVARCSLTESSVFSSTPAPSSRTGSDLRYDVTARPGEYAVICLGGVEDRISGAFTPLVMGVRRHVVGVPGETISGQDVPLDIPLTLDLRVRLDGAPVGNPLTERHEADIFLDLAADGVYRFQQKALGIDQNLFELKRFPAAFEDSLYDATFTVYGRAIANVEREAQTGEGSFVVHDRIGQVFAHSLFEVEPLDDGTLFSRGIGNGAPIRAMSTHPGAPDWLFAPAARGQVMVFDGVVWGLQQTPTSAPLYGIHAESPTDAWAVGAEGAVMRWDGLRWGRAPLPAALARVDVTWWGVTTDIAGRLVLHGNRGVWRWDPNDTAAPNGVTSRLDPDLNVGTVHDVARDGAGNLWMVGRGGLIRRIGVDGQAAILDRPGPDLHAIHILADDLIWVAGAAGRMLRWDGRVFFELLPVGRRDLHALAFASADDGWAVSDGGDVFRWDGARWRHLMTREHQDLRGVGVSGGRVFLAGLPTLVVGPFMQIPVSINPGPDGVLSDLRLRWDVRPWIDPSFNWITLNHPSQFTFWDIVADGRRADIPLPDLTGAWGLRPLWPGENYVQFARIYVPGFDMGAWDGSLFSVGRWRSWSVVAFPLSIPAE